MWGWTTTRRPPLAGHVKGRGSLQVAALLQFFSCCGASQINATMPGFFAVQQSEENIYAYFFLQSTSPTVWYWYALVLNIRKEKRSSAVSRDFKASHCFTVHAHEISNWFAAFLRQFCFARYWFDFWGKVILWLSLVLRYWRILTNFIFYIIINYLCRSIHSFSHLIFLWGGSGGHQP